MDPLPTLCNLGDEANEMFPTLNYGGCCVYVAEVARILQGAGYTVRVVTGQPFSWESDHPRIDDIRDILLKKNYDNKKKCNWSMHDIGFWHVAVQVWVNDEWHSCDSDGVTVGAKHFGKNQEMHAAPGSGFTVEEAIGFASEDQGWNSKFDRGQIPAVHFLIRKHLAALLPTQVQ
jgi:hypothetical protein